MSDVAAEPRPVFFPVSSLKLALLSICTFGIYEVYWFYKNWQLINEHENASLSPFWRAFFAPFYNYWLFRRIATTASAQNCRPIAPGFLAVAWFLIFILWRLPDPYWLVSSLSFIPLLSVQSTISELNRKLAPGSDPNSRLTPGAIALCVVGGAAFALATLVSFLPE